MPWKVMKYLKIRRLPRFYATDKPSTWLQLYPLGRMFAGVQIR